MTHLDHLRELTFLTSDSHCFIEREQYLNAVAVPDAPPLDFYARTLAGLLDTVSTPVNEHDIFVGRVVEGPPPCEAYWPSRLLHSTGHQNPDYARLLKRGYRGILSDIQANAAAIGTAEAAEYAENAAIVVEALRRFAGRYAAAAKAAGNERAARALLRVPYEPARDFYEALQGIWLVHMVKSCYMGSRDYAFGYMDEYLYPYYLREKEEGVTDEALVELLAGFMVKTNEICGRTSHNYRPKPIPSHDSNQYLSIGGDHANALSELIMEAAALACMPQPEITVMLSGAAGEDFRLQVGRYMARLTDKLQVYNYDLICEHLRKKDLPEEIVRGACYSACCTFDLNHHSIRNEYYVPTLQIFCESLYDRDFDSLDALEAAFCDGITKAVQHAVDTARGKLWCTHDGRCGYVLDCLLLDECNDRCAYPPHGMARDVANMFLPGIATLGDSLYAIDKLVFREKRMSWRELSGILKANFEGHEDLRRELLALPKFGNDSEADAATVRIAEKLTRAVEAANHEAREILIPGFYSLERDNSWRDIPATPDGRLAGSPFSENQSPTYGADRAGITALLGSLAKLPFDRAIGGGLNLTFSSPQRGEILAALMAGYFERGGLHMGMTVLDPAVLTDAMANPERHRSLTVRLYGFSEYFISLPEWQQLAILARTRL